MSNCDGEEILVVREWLLEQKMAIMLRATVGVSPSWYTGTWRSRLAAGLRKKVDGWEGCLVSGCLFSGPLP